MPRAENPYLYIVAAGTLRLYTPSGIVDYIEGQYSHSRIDTPLHGTVLAPRRWGISWPSPSSSRRETL